MHPIKAWLVVGAAYGGGVAVAELTRAPGIQWVPVIAVVILLNVLAEVAKRDH